MQEITLKVYTPKEKLPEVGNKQTYLFCTTAGTILTGNFVSIDDINLFEVKRQPYDVAYPIKDVLWWCENIFHYLQDE